MAVLWLERGHIFEALRNQHTVSTEQMSAISINFMTRVRWEHIKGETTPAFGKGRMCRSPARPCSVLHVTSLATSFPESSKQMWSC